MKNMNLGANGAPASARQSNGSTSAAPTPPGSSGGDGSGKLKKDKKKDLKHLGGLFKKH